MQTQQKNTGYDNLSFFSEGEEPTLLEVLDRREERVLEINDVIEQFKNTSVICFKLNIPGKIKNNEIIYKVFRDGVNNIEAAILNLKGIEIKISEEKNLKTGPELLMGVKGVEAKELKMKMVEIENSTKIGRLYDIDVIGDNGAISREEIGMAERKCFLCDKNAKICASSRAHSVEDMLVALENIIKESNVLND